MPLHEERMSAAQSADGLAPASATLSNAGLIVRDGAQFPDACVKCAGTERLTSAPETFRWPPHWLSLLCGAGALLAFFWAHLPLLIAGVLAFLVRHAGSRSAKVVYALCSSCRRRQRIARWVVRVSGGLWMVPAIIQYIGADVLPQEFVFVIGPVAFTLILIQPIVVDRFVRPRIIEVREISNSMLTLAGIHPQVEALLVAALHEPS
jgi:hypothetical protein